MSMQTLISSLQKYSAEGRYNRLTLSLGLGDPPAASWTLCQRITDGNGFLEKLQLERLKLFMHQELSAQQSTSPVLLTLHILLISAADVAEWNCLGVGPPPPPELSFVSGSFLMFSQHFT